MKEKSKLKIKIKFGNLKEEFKNNIYVAGNEKMFENKTTYVYARSRDMLAYPFVYYIDDDPIYNKMINLNRFETYKILEEVK